MDIHQPRPHDATPLIVDKAFGCEKKVVRPTHLRMRNGIKLFVLPLTNKVTATQFMANAHQDIPSIEGEQVSTRDILSDRHSFNTVRQQITRVSPVAVQGLAFGDTRTLAAKDGIVILAIDPAKGVPGPVLIMMRLPRFRLGRDHTKLLPGIQLIIERNRHCIPFFDLVITDSRVAFTIQEAVAAIHAPL